MNTITILIWITIAIIAAIAIIVVKLHYKGDELKHEEGSILPSTESISNTLNFGKSLTNNSKKNSSTNVTRSLSPTSPQHEPDHSLFRKKEAKSEDATYIVPETKNRDNVPQYEYESQNQVLVNYDNKVEKFQEPIKQSQMDIMNQNKDNSKKEDSSELKDLFTIDELIKESKRKDSEREKESQKIHKDEDDTELEEIKESIKNKTPEPLIEEIITEDEKEPVESETATVASQKDIDEAIDTASKEKDEGTEIISQESNITDSLLKSEEISEPALKAPSKVAENKDYELGASIDDANIFGDDDREEDLLDLDYRKDLDKVKNKITSSKLYQDVKERLNPEPEEIPVKEGIQDEFIRTVNEYDEYEPIINETHVDIDEGTYEDYHNQKLRQANTKRVFKARTPTESQPVAEDIRSKPSRNNIKINLNNNEVVLKKGDEIIFNHDGETYSSQVYAINGDDISVRYRGKNIKIKANDVKKIY